MISKYLINENSSILLAIKKIKFLKHKTLLVVKKSKKLVGTITDGDLRRGFLKSNSFNLVIKEIMQKKPIFFYKKTNKINKKKLDLIFKRGAQIIPIINKTKKINDIQFINFKNLDKKNISPVLILAGGRGKRLMPLTKYLPKPMLKINKRPIIENIIINFANHGFKKIYVAVNYKKEKIMNYLKDGKKYNLKIHYLIEKKKLDTAGCLGLLPKSEKSTVLIINGDVITNLNPKLLVEYHHKTQSDLTICSIKHKYKIPYGVIKYKKNKNIEILEKPYIENSINAGIYAISPKIYKKIKSNKKISMIEVINNFSKNNRIIIRNFPIFEKLIDAGDYKIFKSLQKNL